MNKKIITYLILVLFFLIASFIFFRFSLSDKIKYSIDIWVNNDNKFISKKELINECKKVVNWEKSEYLENNKLFLIYHDLLNQNISFEYKLLLWETNCETEFTEKKYINACNVIFDKKKNNNEKVLELEKLYSNNDIYDYTYYSFKAYINNDNKICNILGDLNEDCIEQVNYFKKLFWSELKLYLFELENQLKNNNIDIYNLTMDQKKFIPLVSNYKQYLDMIFIKECSLINN